MIPLSEATKKLKNQLYDSGVWLSLLTLISKDGSVVINIVNNTEDVVFGSTTFTRFPCKLAEVKESNKGELPTVSLTLSNVDRAVQAYVEQDPDLGSGWSVHVDIVHTTALSSGVAEVTYDFVSMGTVADEKSVVFSCGIKNPLRQQFPRVKMFSNACQNTFKKGACTYSGSDTSCMKTLQACRDKFAGQSKIPFFGFPGIPTTGLYK